MKLALLQLNSQEDMPANIAHVEKRVAQAAEQGAQLIATPENTYLMEAPGMERLFFTEDTHPGVSSARALAAKHRIWLLIGSVHVVSASGDAKSYNRSLLINPEGGICARYDKIHLFDVDVPGDRHYRESDRMLGGSGMVVAQAGEASMGLTICYDVRFPHLYRALAKAGATLLSVPAAFTQITGEAHWHILLRARAIENGCFVIAPAQTGMHPGKRMTFGHSLIIDPWGRVLADGGTAEGIVMADIDLSEVAQVRAKLPSLSHDRDFI